MRFVVLATILLQSVFGDRQRWYITEGVESVTIPCSPDAATKIENDGLYLVHWFRVPIDPRDGRPGDVKEKIIEKRGDPEDPNKMQKYGHMTAGDDGSLQITAGMKGGALMNADDQAMFECRLIVGDNEDGDVTDQITILVITILPPLGERKPALIDAQPSVSDVVPHVYPNNFNGNLVTCQSGHASPKPQILWTIYDKDGNEIGTKSPTDGDFSDNPIVLDDDDADILHSVELPLTLYDSADKKSGLTSEYDETMYKCSVTYEVGINGKLEPQTFDAHFPGRQGKVRVQHPVSEIAMSFKGNVVEGDSVDLSFGNVEDMNFACDPNGYDPNSKTESNPPNNQQLQHDIKDILDNRKQGAKITVECSARNGENDDWVTKTRSFDAQYILGGAIDADIVPGARKKDPVTATFDIAASNTPTVVIFPVGKPKLDDAKLATDPEYAAKQAAKLAARPGSDAAATATCNDGSCSFSAPSGKYYALVTVPGNPPVHRVVPIDATSSTARSTSQAEMKDPPIKSTWPVSEHVDDVNKVKVYQNQPDKNGVKLVDISGKTEDDDYDYSKNINNGKEIGKEVPKPSGGEYAVCYDVGDDLADEVAKANGKEDFQASADQLHASMEKYCEFYQMSPGTPP
jgi:hypothetical protein